MKENRSIHIQLGLLLFVAFVIKAFAACSLGLGNDEAYYIAYALYPAISHFDHPPMVGFLIQLTTLNLAYVSEFFIRLGPLVLGTISVFLIYLIGKNLKNERTGLIAAYLATASVYITIICGVFIQPDSPMVFFSLLSFYFFAKFIPYPPKQAKKWDIWFAFLFFGLAIYSKYQSIFLGLGVLLYILFFNRRWFKQYIIYLCALIPLFFIGLIVYWNYQHNFISFTYQADRVSLFSLHLKPLYFLRELGGEIGYYNPINFIIIILAIFSFKKKNFIQRQNYWFILFCSLPLIFSVLYFSLYRGTLPHWVGISYIYLFILAAAYLDSVLKTLKFPVIYAYILIAFGLLAVFVVQKGWFIPGAYTPKQGEIITCGNVSKPPLKWEMRLGHNEGTLFMYGWKQVNQIYKDFIVENPEYYGYPLVECKWFTAAHIDHYVARPNKVRMLVYGPIDNIHEYYWITQKRGSLKKGQNALYITTTHYYLTPAEVLLKYFKKATLLYQAPVYRNGKIVEFVLIYKMDGFIPNIT